MKQEIIGRKKEQGVLKDAYKSTEPQFLAITGRRRVGKTYLVRSYFEGKIDFDLTGILNAPYRHQLKNFFHGLSLQFKLRKDEKPPANWLDAFFMLGEYLQMQPKGKRLVVFIDELPWLDTHRSNFMMGLEWFWNSWATKHNLLLIVCGSATSWIVRNLYNNRGGLHNRITKKLHLRPFSLKETHEYLRHHQVLLSQYQVLQLYMAMGGIPHYLKEVRKGESAIQAVDRICFQANGLLSSEFENLYKALFKHAEVHEKIIRALASKMRGLTRNELLDMVKAKDGGSFSTILSELVWSDFVSAHQPFGKKRKDTLYRLQDEYSIFYLKFMDQKRNVNWLQLSASQAWKSWSGFAFENVCLKHVEQIKAGLGISTVFTEVSGFQAKGSKEVEGVQIDLVIDRHDHVINVCEAKFYDKPFALTKSFAKAFQHKVDIFQAQSATRKSLFPTLITTFGIIPNEHSTGFIQQALKATDLFAH